jgi:hypothetical protein
VQANLHLNVQILRGACIGTCKWNVEHAIAGANRPGGRPGGARCAPRASLAGLLRRLSGSRPVISKFQGVFVPFESRGRDRFHWSYCLTRRSASFGYLEISGAWKNRVRPDCRPICKKPRNRKLFSTSGNGALKDCASVNAGRREFYWRVRARRISPCGNCAKIHFFVISGAFFSP